MKRSSQIAKVKRLYESVDTKGLESQLKSDGFEQGDIDDIISILVEKPNSVVYQSILDREDADKLGMNTTDDVDKLSQTDMLRYFLNDNLLVSKVMAFSSLDEARDDSESRVNNHPKLDQMLDYAEANPDVTPEEIMRAMEENDIELDGDDLNEAVMMDIETELHIPVKDVEKYVLSRLKKSDAQDMHTWDLLDNYPSYVEEYVTKLIDKELKGKKVEMKATNFLETDSGNPSHANGIYSVILRGDREELKKVAGEDKAFFYPNDKLDEADIDAVHSEHDYGGFGDIFDINRVPKLGNVSVFEADKVNTMYALKDIDKFNRGEIKSVDDLADSILRNLGYKPTKGNLKAVEDHFGGSADDDGKIPADATLIKELIPMLEQVTDPVNEASFKEDDKVTLQTVDTIDGGTITGDYVVLGTGNLKADGGKRYDVLIVQDDDGVPHSKGGMKIWTVYANSGKITKRNDY